MPPVTPFTSAALWPEAPPYRHDSGVTPGRLPFPLTLTGSGVVLREWRSDDLDDLIVMLDDPDIARWTPMPSPFDVEAGIA